MVSSFWRTASYKPWLLAYGLFSLLWVMSLLFAGGFTTSIHAGMAFLDWPLSNGSLNPQGWMGQSDQLAEHSHRLLGMKVGFLSIGLLIWVNLTESRAWLRKLTYWLLGLIIFQGCLGGGRVLLDPLNGMSEPWVARTFAILHACGAQAVLCLWVTTVLPQGKYWLQAPVRPVSSKISTWGALACGVLCVQLILGAVMRHADAGLAIPTFPKMPDGAWLPTDWSFPVAIHFAHRIWACVATGVILAFLMKAYRADFLKGWPRLWGAGALVLLGVQIFLGITVVLTLKNPYSATLHMLIGAFLLACMWGLTLFSYRPRLFCWP